MKLKRFISCILLLVMAMSILTGCSMHEIKNKYYELTGKEVVTETTTVESLEVVAPSSAEFVFDAPDITTAGELVDVADITKIVYLYLDEGLYYPIVLPADLEIVTDNSKYIYATDNSVSVSVVSNIDAIQFSESVFIEDADSIKSNLLVSKIGAKGPQEAAIHIVNDKAIIVRAYDNPEAYSTILYGLENYNYYKSSNAEVIIDEERTNVLSSLPSYSGYMMTVAVGLGDSLQKIYSYDSGSLTVSSELRRMDQAYELLASKIAIVSDQNYADLYYESEEVIYVEAGDYVIGLYSVNYNTTLTCFGYGIEAKYNTIEFLKAQLE